MNEKSCQCESGSPRLFVSGNNDSSTKNFPAIPIHRYENALIDSYISNQSLLKVFTVNSAQEHGKIRSHDEKIIILVHEPFDGVSLMYKHAISTVETIHAPKPAVNLDPDFDPLSLLPDIYKPSLLSSRLEEEWLDKFVRNQNFLTFFTLKGYQEHGTLIAHDENVVVFCRYRGDRPNLIYKSALSTIFAKY